MLSIRSKRLLCLEILLFLVIGCGKSKSTPTSTPLPTSAPVTVLVESDNFKFIDCPFQIPEGTSQDAMPPIQCATLTVLEDRKQPDGPKIKLAVAIVKSTSTTPKPDPVLVLVGDPGYGLNLATSLQYILQSVYTQRDLIIVDQRGTGYSQPSFNCPEFDDFSHQVVTQNLNMEEANTLYVEASRTCVDRVKATTTNYPAYTTAAVAADLDDLRLALGYHQWNIYSFMDGSRLALTMMRDYPQGIRSVVLDSVVPLQANPTAELGANVELAFNQLFQRCTEDEQCNKAFPKLKSTFYALLDQLDSHSILVDVADLNSGELYKVMLDSERLINFIMILLNSSIDRGALPEVPRMIYQLRDGKTEVAARLLGSYPMFSTGNSAMGQWMGCNEENYFITLEQVAKANENIELHLRKYFDAQAEGTSRACKEWLAPGVPAIENEPVTSDIPALLVAGEFDWYAPPTLAERTAQTLSNSTEVEFPGTGQIIYLSPLWSECSHKIVDAFLETPTAKPDTSCASKPIKLLWVTLP